MHRLERLINLVAALLAAEQPLSADDLRRRVPGYAEDRVAFRRAFERDKETLREMGVPVRVEPVPGTDPPLDGYRVVGDEYYLRDPGLADDELAALHLAASAVRVEGADGVAALWKLGGEVAEGGPAATAAAVPGSKHLGALFAAVAARRRVAFDHRGRRRRVDPLRLSFRNGWWYLAAHDLDAGEGRSFRLDRLGDRLEVGPDGSAEVHPVPADAPPPWETGGGVPLVARLWVDASQAAWAERQVGGASVERRADGSVVLGVRVTNREAFRSFVLGFLDHAEVLEPPDLRAEMVEWLEQLCRG